MTRIEFSWSWESSIDAIWSVGFAINNANGVWHPLALFDVLATGTAGGAPALFFLTRPP